MYRNVSILISEDENSHIEDYVRSSKHRAYSKYLVVNYYIVNNHQSCNILISITTNDVHKNVFCFKFQKRYTTRELCKQTYWSEQVTVPTSK